VTPLHAHEYVKRSLYHYLADTGAISLNAVHRFAPVGLRFKQGTDFYSIGTSVASLIHLPSHIPQRRTCHRDKHRPFHFVFEIRMNYAFKLTHSGFPLFHHTLNVVTVFFNSGWRSWQQEQEVALVELVEGRRGTKEGEKFDEKPSVTRLGTPNSSQIGHQFRATAVITAKAEIAMANSGFLGI
jgi:hypothetical protein